MDKEAVYGYMVQAVKALKEGGNTAVGEIMSREDGRPVLMVITGPEKFFLTPEISERGRIARIKLENE